MKAYLLIFLLMPAVYALDIGLSVNKYFTMDVLYLSYNNTHVANVFSTEILNSGSLPYAAQIRLDVFNESGPVFTGWSDRKVMAPGGNGFFRIYWHPEDSGGYTARARIFYGNQMREESFNITAVKHETDDIFDIRVERVLNRYVEFAVSSSKRTENVTIIPDEYYEGSVFTQARIDRLDSEKRAFMSYDSPLWSPTDLVVYVASNDGLTKKTVHLEKSNDLESAIRNLVFDILIP